MLRLFVLMIAFLMPRLALAQCSDVVESDERNLCRAIASESAGYCTMIGHADKRAYCRAVLGANSQGCDQITNSAYRNRCTGYAEYRSILNAATEANGPFDVNQECGTIYATVYRNLCRGMLTRNTSYCAMVSDRDIRAYCYANVQESRSYCNQIQDIATRAACTVAVQNGEGRGVGAIDKPASARVYRYR